jgi:hypothetical protein
MARNVLRSAEEQQYYEQVCSKVGVCTIQEIDGGLARELRPSMCLGVSTKDAQAGKGFADRGQPTGPMGCQAS